MPGMRCELAEHWDVPIYAHPLELPYLTGRSAYPPPDPTIGGAIGFLSRFMPSKALRLSARVFSRCATTRCPGCRIGNGSRRPAIRRVISRSSAALIACCSRATPLRRMDMESWPGLITGRRTLARAGAPFNCDWSATRASVQKLADLRPDVVACGHGKPYAVRTDRAPPARFAARFRPPRRGRYVRAAGASRR